MSETRFNFITGQRVRYIGGGADNGMLGTVRREIHSDDEGHFVSVTLDVPRDNGRETVDSWFAGNTQPLPPEVGTRVEYRPTYPGSRTDWNGERGTVVSVSNGGFTAEVRFDNPDTSINPASVSTQTLYVIGTAMPRPDNDAIEAALATLRAAGEVSDEGGVFTFKRRKPPFEAIYILGVGDYVATVQADHVKVGCQRISFAKVREVYEAVLKAEEYNNS